VIIAGSHPPSVDATCCQIMELDPREVRYLQLVSRRSAWNYDSIEQAGESVGSVRKRFALIPELERFRLVREGAMHSAG